MIAKELTTVATTTRSNNSKDRNVRLTVAFQLKTTSLISIIALRAKIPNAPVDLFRVELARELQSLGIITEIPRY